MLSKSENCLRDENDRTEWNFNLKNWYKWQKINSFMATELITRLADWRRDEIFEAGTLKTLSGMKNVLFDVDYYLQ